jgi:hypothetical protein
MLNCDLENFSCLKDGFIDLYGDIQEHIMPYSNEASKCYNDMTPRQAISKYDEVKASFQHKKLRYQRAKLESETEREIQRTKYH